MWRQSHLILDQNPAVSRLAGAPVCGDAVAVVSLSASERDTAAVDRVLHLLQRTTTKLPPSKAALADAADDCCVPATPPHADPGSCEPLDPHAAGGHWAELPPELLGNIVRLAGPKASLARIVTQVCPFWRDSLAADTCTWQLLELQTVRLVGFGPGVRRNPPPLPWVLRQAMAAGNVIATVVAARFLEAAAEIDDARKCWLRAARWGHPEGQWKVGVAYYEGSLGAHQDSEEAMLWLMRAAKALLPLFDPPEETSELGGAAAAAVSRVSLPPLMSFKTCKTALSQSAHIVGVLHLDGDAVAQDASAAIRWFQVAHRFGCLEAGRLLQSLFRSGQY